MEWFYIVLFSSLIVGNISYNSMQIKDLQIIKCNSKSYPVSVNNVTVHLGTKPRVKVSGSLNSAVDLVGPVRAEIWLKRNVWGVWIPVPCEEKIGSCTYDNLCDYGIPTNTSCPKVFQENNVPCRCPIPKGNYTILSTTIDDILPLSATSILSGKYKGTVEITQNTRLLSCYYVYFTLYDQTDSKNDAYSVLLV